MKKNVMAEKEELRVNERLITSRTHKKLIPEGNLYTGTWGEGGEEDNKERRRG